MVKIKRKVEMTLHEVIKWAWDNDITDKVYRCNHLQGQTIRFDQYGLVDFSDKYKYTKTDKFTVEVEEEITKDKALNHLVIAYTNPVHGDGSKSYKNESIKNILKLERNRNPLNRSLSITYFDENGLPHLIWRKGAMFE
ncbi:hypothetical protein [Staphylococcus pasteuri]|uniref:hypothetical protein n=2 Tax=Staphylococcus pasteuri TaxID=45972 RepID=UPI0013586F98